VFGESVNPTSSIESPLPPLSAAKTERRNSLILTSNCEIAEFETSQWYFRLDTVNIHVTVNCMVGVAVGADVVGVCVGVDVVGMNVGADVGADVGDDVGLDVGADVGLDVGRVVGVAVGACDGAELMNRSWISTNALREASSPS
jgi:hypothetical protein